MSATIPIDSNEKNSKSIPAIVIDTLPNDNDLTLVPACPTFPTTEQPSVQWDPANASESASMAEDPSGKESTNTIEDPSSEQTVRPSQQSLQLLDELKYLLRPTNSLASPLDSVQASQEADSAIQRRTLHLDEDAANEFGRSLIEGLSAQEAKSLLAAERRSIASRGRPSSIALSANNRSRAKSMQPMMRTSIYSQANSPTGANANPTFVDYLPGIFWAFVAAYAFTLIIFLTKAFGIDLIFGYFLQMLVQTLAFAIYAFYKSYSLLGSAEYRLKMILWALLMSLGTLALFLAYYYITLPELSALRQTQVVFSILLSIFFFHERITVIRVLGCILTIIAIVVLFRPITYGAGVIPMLNVTHDATTWLPYSSSWNYLIGLVLAIVTALMFAIASMFNRKLSMIDEPLPNTTRCFWSAVFGLILSIGFLSVTHFAMKNRRSFPQDWRFFVAVALAVASIFVFVANQKAIKRLPASAVTIIYSTDILFALILQNIFTYLRTDFVIFFGCLGILIAIFIIAAEFYLDERRKKAVAKRVAKVVEASQSLDAKQPSSHPAKLVPKRSSL